MRIGEQLQKQRKLHQMSQDDLAQKLGISRQAISRWENGATLPSFSNVVAISDLFGLSLDELIRGDVELMNKLDETKPKTKWTLFDKVSLIGVVVAIILAEIIKHFNWNQSGTYTMYYWIIAIVATFGLLTNLEWKGIIREFNRNVNRKTIIWIGILIVLFYVRLSFL